MVTKGGSSTSDAQNCGAKESKGEAAVKPAHNFRIGLVPFG